MIKITWEAPSTFEWYASEEMSEFPVPPRKGDLVVCLKELKWEVVAVEWFGSRDVRIVLVKWIG